MQKSIYNYPFGSPMPNRSFSASSYKYGFNGKENDNETVATGSGTQDYGMRIYNVALGKFLSIDPITKSYPWYTPYQFAGNKPIMAVDLDGEEEKPKIFVAPAGDVQMKVATKNETHIIATITEEITVSVGVQFTEQFKGMEGFNLNLMSFEVFSMKTISQIDLNTGVVTHVSTEYNYPFSGKGSKVEQALEISTPLGNIGGSNKFKIRGWDADYVPCSNEQEGGYSAPLLKKGDVGLSAKKSYSNGEENKDGMNLFGIEVAGKEAVVVGVEAKVSVEFSAKTVEVFQKPKEVKQDKPKGKPILLNKNQL